MNDNADAPDPTAADRNDSERGTVEATVIGSLPNSMVRLRLPDGRQVTGHAAQNTRMAFVRLVEGDVVRIETSPFDPNRARILGIETRHRAKQQRTNPYPQSQREEP